MLFKTCLIYLTLILLISFALISCQETQTSYSILNFGAVANDTLLDTEAIQKAIDECSASGGGTVIIPTGVFMSGTLILKSNVSIHLEGGALLQASGRITDYPGEKKTFITGNNLKNLSISGNGIIDGAGEAFWDDNYKPLERPEPWIRLSNCQNLHIAQVLFRNSPSHTIRLEQSENVKFNGISIVNPFLGPNTDGIDVVDSKNILISNSFISTGDDAICLKSQRDTVESVVVTNCILESDDAAIKFGTGSHVATRLCSFSNITIRKTRYGISLFMLDGGVFEHNLFSNLIIENGSRHKHEYPIFIDIDKRTPDRSYGNVNDNSFSNIKMITDGKVLIAGHPESRIKNLTFDNISFYTSGGVDFDNARKPRGNKNYPKLETSIDLAPKAAHFTFGHVDNLLLRDVTLYTSEHNTKEMLYTEAVTSFERSNFKSIIMP